MFPFFVEKASWKPTRKQKRRTLVTLLHGQLLSVETENGNRFCVGDKIKQHNTTTKHAKNKKDDRKRNGKQERSGV